MSTNTRGLLCEGVMMIWVLLDLSHRKLSNEHQYEASIV